MAKQRTPTDDELAIRWIEREEESGRLWLYAAKQWFKYNGKDGIWVNSDCEYLVEKGIWQILKEAKAEGVSPTRTRLNSVIEGAGRGELNTSINIFDDNENILVCNNGALDLTTRKLNPHSPKYYMTQKVHYDYDESAKAPHFMVALAGATKGDQATMCFLQEFAGYCLTTETKHEVAVWLWGPPASGKSTILEGFLAMAGDMSTSFGLNSFKDGKTYGIAELQGKRVAIATEQPAGQMDATEVINAIISGEFIQVERKYVQPYDMRPTTKIIWAMNELPKIYKRGDGIFRRIKVVEFEQIPEDQRDPKMKEAVKEEGDGILNWALDGLDRLRANGKFTESESITKSTQEYKENADTIKLFLDEMCEWSEEYSVQSNPLYKTYVQWANDNNHHPMASNNIAREFERLGLVKEQRRDANYWVGVRMKTLEL